MDSAEWEELGSIVVEALALPEAQRADFLDEVCGANTALRTEVVSLLEGYEAAPTFFQKLGDGVVPSPGAIELPDTPRPDPHGLVGTQVGPYRVVGRLGSGGMGVVYRAEDTRLGRTVALKFLPPALSQDDHARRRFLHEARAASALDHPNICTVYEIGETKPGTGYGQAFIAMACYDGETLRQHIKRGPLPIHQALDVALQIAAGLACAHARGIIHRDLKPANVMIPTSGPIKVLDFGLAKITSSIQLTRSGTTLGTAAYMSPEQAGSTKTDHRTDIWSLGVILYEMISGQRPFPGDFAPAVLRSVLHDDPAPVASLRTGLPMQLVQVIGKAMAKDPDVRYQHMDSLIEDLRAVQERTTARASAAREMLPETRIHSAPSQASIAGVQGGAEQGPVTILVVDDEPDLELLIRKRFRRRVKAGEWAIKFAGDGREALQHLHAMPEIGLVLTDINMPGMDGLTLLSHIEELERPLKSIVVSAYGDMENIRTAMNRGAFDFILKPINFDDLDATIDKARQAWQASHQATEAHRQVAAMQQELEVARRIQEAVLPVSFPEHGDVEFYGFTTPAREISGTFYDYFQLGPDRVGFISGDVAGKGVSAALFMAMSHTFLKGIALRGEAPGACLTEMNRLLFPEGFPELAVSVFYGLLDAEKGTLVYCNADHPAPYLLRTTGTLDVLAVPEVGPVWQQRGQTYETKEVQMRPGDSIFIFTRGMPGALDEHGNAFSTDRLAALLREHHPATPSHLIRAVVRAVMDHADETPLADDLTALALRYRGR